MKDVSKLKRHPDVVKYGYAVQLKKKNYEKNSAKICNENIHRFGISFSTTLRRKNKSNRVRTKDAFCRSARVLVSELFLMAFLDVSDAILFKFSPFRRHSTHV